MADSESRARLGKILTGIGSAWFALYFLARFINVGGTPFGDILAFFGSSFFIPIALLFTGRSIRRRSRRVSVEDVLDTQTAQTEQPRPAPSRPAERKPAPPPPDPEPEPVDMDQLAEAIGFDASEDAPSLSDSEVEGVQPKTSAEMIAEAHRRYEKDGS